MEAEELMLGDILHFTGTKYYHPCNVKVLSLYNREGGYPPASFDLHDFENNCVLANISKMYIEPIPLTVGMLENNDIYDIYEKDDIPLFQTYKLKTRYGFRFQNCHPCTISISANILYVHELQHLLRLCGLTELANNFKVV